MRDRSAAFRTSEDAVAGPIKAVIVALAVILIVGSFMIEEELAEEQDDGGGDTDEDEFALGDRMSVFKRFRNDTGTVLLYHFDEDTEDIVVDETRTYNGTMHGDPEHVKGVFGQALQFDGVDDHLDTTFKSHFEPAGEFTIELWFNTPNTEGQHSMYLFGVEMGTGDGPRLSAAIPEKGSEGYPGLFVEFADNAETSIRLESGSSYDDGEWHYLAFVRTLNTFELYIDLALVDSTGDISNDDTDMTDTLYLGTHNHRQRQTHYTGAIDEFRISNVARNIAPLFSIRMTGTPGNSVDVVVSQRTILGSFEIVRSNGSPDTGIIGYDIDLNEDIVLDITFDSDEGTGSNPVWIVMDGKKDRITTFKAFKKDDKKWVQKYTYTIEMS